MNLTYSISLLASTVTGNKFPEWFVYKYLSRTGENPGKRNCKKSVKRFVNKVRLLGVEAFTLVTSQRKSYIYEKPNSGFYFLHTRRVYRAMGISSSRGGFSKRDIVKVPSRQIFVRIVTILFSRLSLWHISQLSQNHWHQWWVFKISSMYTVHTALYKMKQYNKKEK